MMHYKRQPFNPADWAVLEGKTLHEIEIPFAEELDLWVDFRATDDVTLCLVFMDGKRIPYAHGSSGRFNLKTQGLISVQVLSSVKTLTALCMSWKDLWVKESGFIPVVISPPSSAQIDLSVMMREEVRRQLEDRGILKLEVGDEDNLEEDESDEGFGTGYMEEDDAIVQQRRAGKAAKKRGKSASVLPTGSSDVGASGAASEPAAAVSDEKSS